MGGFTDFKPNWAAPGYATLVALALGGLSQWQARALGLVRGIGTANMAIAVAFTAVSAFHLIRPMIPFPRGADPTVDMDGWPAIAARVREAAARLESKGGAAPFIAAGRYQLASRLEFYLPRHPEVISLNPGRDAYDDWQDLARLEGRNFVFVASDRFPTPPDRLARCESARVYSRMTTAVRRTERFGVTIYQAWGYRPGPVAAP